MAESNAPAVDQAHVKKVRKKLGLLTCILFGMGVMVPVAPAAVWGQVMPISQGHMALCYIIACIPMTLTAWSYGRIGAEFPRAGSSYTFVGNGIHPYAGFITGWAIILGYIMFVLMDFVFLTIFFQVLFPNTNYILVMVVFILIIGFLCLIGVKGVASINNILTMFGFAVMFYFIIACIVTAAGGEGWGISSKALINPETFSWPVIMAGVSIACFSFIGFDAITTIVEDIDRPKRNLPRATIIVCLIMAAIFAVSAFFGQNIFPDFNGYSTPDDAFVDVAFVAGGNLLVTFVAIACVVCSFAFELDMITSASQVLLGMGRDKILPNKFFGYTNKKGTPVLNIILIMVICLACVNVSLGDSVMLVNFGVFVAFIMVNLALIVYFWGKKKERGGGNVFKFLIAPGLGFITCIIILFGLDPTILMIGFGWLILGIIYLAIWSRGFKRPIVMTGVGEEALVSEEEEVAEEA